MSILKRRIVSQEAPDLRIVGRYATPEQTPLMRISILPGTITYETLQPLIASDGAPIAATGPSSWGQLYKAGKM